MDFPPGSRFPHPDTGQFCAVYDSEPRSWRHMNFFQFECYVNAHGRRVDGGSGSDVNRVTVPWGRPQSGFTLLMESMMLALAQSGMTVAETARTLGEYPRRVWTILLHHVARAHERLELGSFRVVSVDEVCRARGQNYLTIISEPMQDGRPTRADAGADPDDSFGPEPGVHQRYLGGVRGCAARLRLFPRGAMGQAGTGPGAATGTTGVFGELTGVRGTMLKGEDKLTEEQRTSRRRVCAGKLQTGKAFNHLDALREIMKEPDAAVAERDLKGWCGWVGRSKIPEMKKAARTLREHWDGVVAYLKTRVTNGAAEALNDIIQTVKRKARGFGTVEY